MNVFKKSELECNNNNEYSTKEKTYPECKEILLGKNLSKRNSISQINKFENDENQLPLENNSAEIKISENDKNQLSLENHIHNFDIILNFLDAKIDYMSRHKEKGIKYLRTTRKKIKNLRVEATKIPRTKKFKKRKNGDSGLTIKQIISNELAEFLNIKEGSLLSRSEVTCALCVYIYLNKNETRENMIKWSYLNPKGERNLKNQLKTREILPDKKLSELLYYEEYKKKVKEGKIIKKVYDEEANIVTETIITDPSLTYWSMQKLLSIHFLNEKYSK